VLERSLVNLRLLLDLDGTTLRNAGREVMARELNLPIPQGNSGAWLSEGILEAMGITVERFWEVWQTHQEEIYGKAVPLPGAVETLHALKARGAHIAIVTARRDHAEAVTVAWLAAHGVPYDAIRFGCDDKLAVAQELGLNLAVDDDLRVALRLAEGLPVMLMDTDGRHNAIQLPENVHRIGGWGEVPDLVRRLMLGAA
jgi:uncharacterized HAD superfamily protein